MRINNGTKIEVREVPVIDPNSACEMWVTKNFRRLTVGEMEESHAKHTLALILRHLRAGRRPVFDQDGRLCWRKPLADLSEWKEEIEREQQRAADERFDLMSSIDPLGQDTFFAGHPLGKGPL